MLAITAMQPEDFYLPVFPGEKIYLVYCKNNGWFLQRRQNKHTHGKTSKAGINARLLQKF
jgi:hypothetical protein